MLRVQTESAVGILEGPVLRKCNQTGAGDQLTKRPIETCIAEGLSSIANHDCSISAIRIILEFLDQIWMNEKRGRAIVSGQPFPRTLGWCEELTLSDAKPESSKALQNHMLRHASGVGHEAQ